MSERQDVEREPAGFVLSHDEQRGVIEHLLLTGLQEQALAEEARQRVATLEVQAFHDPLTALPNRVLFLDRLGQQLRAAARERTTFAVLFLDLNGFKAINDRHGHAAGDLILQAVAARLRGALRKADTVARFHGDEFAVLLPGDNATTAALVTRKLRRALAVPIALPGAAVRLMASIGCAVYPAHGAEAMTLLARADAAMYATKRREHARAGRVAAIASRTTPVAAFVTGIADHAAEQDRLGRRHILMVNSDPTILDLTRQLLHQARYNVTTTNTVPLTFALIAAARPALIIIDLAVTEQHGWDLLVRLHAEARTAAIRVLVTATDIRLLDHAARYPDLYGGEVKLVIPFSADTLLDAVQGLIGAA